MEGIRLIGISICVTTVVASIFSMLTPDTRLDKVLKFAISLFFLTGLISPFVNNKLNFHIDLGDIQSSSKQQELSQSVSSQFKSVVEKNIESSLEKQLSEKNISVKKIEVFININEDDSISINKLMVYIEKSSDETQQNIKKLIKESVGVTPEVVASS